MAIEKPLRDVGEHLEEVISQETPLGQSLWDSLVETHPADIGHFFTEIDRDSAWLLFAQFPKELKHDVFAQISHTLQSFFLERMDDQDRADAMHTLNADELTDLFDHLSDEELKRYLNALHKNVRQKVLALLQFDPESAGGIMDIEVLTLMLDFTVEKSVKLLQRLQPSREIHQQIYVTNRAHRLEGHINLEDLVLHGPQERISSFMRKNELVAFAQEDRETVAKRMVHYGLTTAPVVDDKNHFLGVIPGDTLVDVIMKEATEDVQKMAALAPMRASYFETSIARIFFQRGYILVALLIAESVSGSILKAHEAALTALLYSFLPMLISAGGNASNQTSAVVIQGMASGQIDMSDVRRFFKREICVAFLLACVLSIVAFLRVYWPSGALVESMAVASAVWLIVVLSVTLGSGVPLLLKRFNIDPAFSAGPFLATVMDILGVLIFCYISKYIFSFAANLGFA